MYLLNAYKHISNLQKLSSIVSAYGIKIYVTRIITFALCDNNNVLTRNGKLCSDIKTFLHYSDFKKQNTCIPNASRPT